VFGELARGGALARVDQVLIELHFAQPHTNLEGPASGVRAVFAFFEAIEAAGLLPFSWEVNHNAGAAGVMPWVIEYSFVRPEKLPSCGTLALGRRCRGEGGVDGCLQGGSQRKGGEGACDVSDRQMNRQTRE
jgi:hypothetical protein